MNFKKADNFKKTQPRWVDFWARDTVRWYWLADTLFWQLSSDNNVYVQYEEIWKQYQVAPWLPN